MGIAPILQVSEDSTLHASPPAKRYALWPVHCLWDLVVFPWGASPDFCDVTHLYLKIPTLKALRTLEIDMSEKSKLRSRVLALKKIMICTLFALPGCEKESVEPESQSAKQPALAQFQQAILREGQAFGNWPLKGVSYEQVMA